MQTNKITLQQWKRAYEAPKDSTAPRYGFRTLPDSDVKIDVEFYNIHKCILIIHDEKYSVKFSENRIGSVFKVHDKNKKLVAEYFRLRKWLFVGELKLIIYDKTPCIDWSSNYIKFRREKHRITNQNQSIEYSYYHPSFSETLKDYFSKTIVDIECSEKINNCVLEIGLGLVIQFIEDYILDQTRNH